MKNPKDPIRNRTHVLQVFSTVPQPNHHNINRLLLAEHQLKDANFHSRAVHLDIIKVLLPTDAQNNFFKRSIKIFIKTAPTCFGVITIIREVTV
jgi:hypothetical protein